MIKVKVCGLKDPGNVRKITALDIDYAGFIFYPASKRYVGKKPEAGLFSCVPSGIKKTGVFVNEDMENVLKISRMYGLDIVQLHGNESIEYCRELKNNGLTVIKVFHIKNEIDQDAVNSYSDVCDYFLFDTAADSYGGVGEKFNWDVLKKGKFKRPFFLGGGIGPEDFNELKRIKNEMFYAVDINSRFETSPGIKDYEKIRFFVDHLKK